MSEPAGAATIGQEVRDSSFGFTVTKVDPPTKSIGTQTAKGNYVVVHLTVSDIGKEPEQFWAALTMPTRGWLHRGR
jgi:hypothetical protein